MQVDRLLLLLRLFLHQQPFQERLALHGNPVAPSEQHGARLVAVATLGRLPGVQHWGVGVLLQVVAGAVQVSWQGSFESYFFWRLWREA